LPKIDGSLQDLCGTHCLFIFGDEFLFLLFTISFLLTTITLQRPVDSSRATGNLQLIELLTNTQIDVLCTWTILPLKL